MFGINDGMQFYVCQRYVRMNLGINGLFNIVRSEMELPPLGGAVFIFFSKNRQQVKMLRWDRDGLLLYQKRLERGTFELPLFNAGFEGEFIGRSIANYQLYVVDTNMNLVPDGVAGELLIGGVGVARGYLNRPELTAEKFVMFNGERAYRSGDLVRWATDPRDGSRQLEFLGRIDGQVKLRGLRIELGEIENRVAAFAGIGQVCVVVKEIGGMQNLVCYYTLKNDDPSLREPQDKLSSGQAHDDNFNEKLKAFLSETLTAFMVPEVYVKLDAMPLTSNGKINRKALPEPDMSTQIVEIVAPETEMEQNLFSIAAELLKHDQFGVTTNLLTVGLTSLTAMRLSALILQRLETTIPTKSIMLTPTIREMAASIQSKDSSLFTLHSTLHAKRDYYPLTENQRGIYEDWEMNRDTTQYNIPYVQKFDDVDADTLQSALQKHPYLKMRLSIHDSDVMQQRRDNAAVGISICEISSEPSVEFLQQRVRPFDLFHDDLCRFEIYAQSSEDGQHKIYLFMDIPSVK